MAKQKKQLVERGKDIKVRTRRTKEQIQLDNISYVLKRNKDAIDEAMSRYDLLEESGFTTSFAFQKAELEGGRFDFTGKNYNEVLAELTRAYEFIADPGSRVERAKEEGRKYQNLFGKGQWTRTNIYENTTTSTDPEIARHMLNEEAASRAFRAYRNIERLRAAEIVNVGGFGSDTFVGYLYSMELQGKDSGVYGNEILDMLEESNYGITRDFDDDFYIPSNYSEVTRKSRNMKKGDIYENEF